MSKKIPQGQARLFLQGGKAGRHPGDGPRNLAGTGPQNDRPTAGYGLRKNGRNRKPPKGFKP